MIRSCCPANQGAALTLWKMASASSTVPVPPPYGLCASEVLKKMWGCCYQDVLWQDASGIPNSSCLLQLTQVWKNLQRHKWQDHWGWAPSPSCLPVCHLPAASPEQLSPHPRPGQHHLFSPTCKYKSAQGTLCSLENFTDHSVKPPCHPSLLIAAAEAHLGSSGQHHIQPVDEGTYFDKCAKGAWVEKTPTEKVRWAFKLFISPLDC